MTTTITFEDDAGAAVSLVFDIRNQETIELQDVITEFPIEDGAPITDNIQRALDKFTIEGYVSDKPTLGNPGVHDASQFSNVELQLPEYPSLGLSISGLARGAIGAIGGALGLGGASGPSKVAMLTFDDFKSRTRAALEVLQKARGRRLRIITALKEYESMVLSQITVTRTPGEGNGATFTLALTEVISVSSDVSIAPTPSESLGALKKAIGKKSPIPTPAAADAPQKSTAAQLYDKIAGLFGGGGGSSLPSLP